MKPRLAFSSAVLAVALTTLTACSGVYSTPPPNSGDSRTDSGRAGGGSSSGGGGEARSTSGNGRGGDHGSHGR